VILIETAGFFLKVGNVPITAIIKLKKKKKRFVILTGGFSIWVGGSWKGSQWTESFFTQKRKEIEVKFIINQIFEC